MNDVSKLTQSTLASIWSFRHPIDKPHVDESQAEVSQTFSVNYVESGNFAITHKGVKTVLSPGDVLVLRPQEEIIFDHDEDYPADVCTCVEYETGVIEDSFGFRDLFPVRHIRRSVFTLFLNDQIRRGTSSKDAMTVDYSVFNTALALFGESTKKTYPRNLDRNFSWYSRRIQRACDFMSTSSASDLSLSRVAREVGMSPFVFARTFKRITGRSPHHYLIRVRLAKAASLLRAGSPVTDVAFATGFNNLSHFIRSFTRSHGVSPGKFRTLKRV